MTSGRNTRRKAFISRSNGAWGNRAVEMATTKRTITGISPLAGTTENNSYNREATRFV